ncbi:hypothetical protein O5O45_00005 [Hahella aquimaris]|uniref:hypothetical protein n=1 Tax=Hahella sp. HNIBRBA332 TaxID=3015983 RepID=UPI00273CC9B9|nr:hypothetical protein [Hahella sp. HNIBRBA332]WLQ14322.1 hypothetical protein O5O45_00005 [Hahella sp. HNIBRBA332]
MTRGSLGAKALTVLLRVMNTPRMEVAADFLASSGVLDEVLAAGLALPCGTARMSLWVDDRERELMRNPDGPGYRYFSEAAGWVAASAREVGRYRTEATRVLALVRGWLDIPSQPPLAPLRADAIWDLGDMWVGKRRLAVLFMRRAHLSASVAQLRDALSLFPRRRSAVVLTDVTMNAFGPSLPGEPLCVALASLVSTGRPVVTDIDKRLIAELLGAAPPQTGRKTPVYCSDDGGELRVNGEDFVFTGVTQQRIVRRLYEAWEAGRPRLRTAAVLEEAESLASLVSTGRPVVTDIDKRLIAELLGAAPPQTGRKTPVYCSDDGGELRVNGEDFVFTGVTQQRIVRRLYEAWEAGRPRLRTAAVLEEAESKATALSQAFSGYKGDWRKAIGYGGGFCWLIVE